MQATLRGIHFPKWLLILAILAIAAAIAVPLVLTTGGSAGSAIGAPEASNSAPAITPSTSVNTEKDSISGQETAPAEGSVFLPTKTDEAKTASSPFVGTGVYSLQALEALLKNPKNIELNAGITAAYVFFFMEQAVKQNPNVFVSRETNKIIGDPAIWMLVGRQFEKNRAPLQAVTIEPSRKNKGTAIPSQGVWMCATIHQGWAQEQTQQRSYAIQWIYGIEEANEIKVWTLIDITSGC